MKYLLGKLRVYIICSCCQVQGRIKGQQQRLRTELAVELLFLQTWKVWTWLAPQLKRNGSGRQRNNESKYIYTHTKKHRHIYMYIYLEGFLLTPQPKCATFQHVEISWNIITSLNWSERFQALKPLLSHHISIPLFLNVAFVSSQNKWGLH